MPLYEKAYPIRKRILQIIEVGALEDYPSRAYDIVNMLSIVINLLVSVLYTYQEVRAAAPFCRKAIRWFWAPPCLTRMSTSTSRRSCSSSTVRGTVR